MSDAPQHYQLLFAGVPAGTTDEQRDRLIARLIQEFRMSTAQAAQLLQMRHSVIQSHLSQGPAFAVANLFRSIGLMVVAMPMPLATPATAPPPAPRPATHCAPAFGAPPPLKEFLPAGACPDDARAQPRSPVLICPECQAKVRVRDPANVRCAMCSTRITLQVS